MAFFFDWLVNNKYSFGLALVEILVLMGGLFFLPPSPLLRWGVVVVVVLLEVLREIVRKKQADLRAELSMVGDWVLRNALTDDPIGEERIEEPGAPASRQLPREMDKWFDAIHDELLRTDEEVHEAYKMECDLILAKDFQRAYMERPYPPIPDPETGTGRLALKFHHYYSPTMTLGGDFFDISALGPDSAGVMIADVMGHGARSALITAILRAMIQELSGMGQDVPRFMAEINRRFMDLIKNVDECLFVSAFYLTADVSREKAVYVAAGHPAPFLVERNSGRVRQIEVPSTQGSAFGFIPGEQYSAGTCDLRDGDVLLFFTDGIFEAQNAEREEYGLERMQQVLEGASSLSAEEIVTRVVHSVNSFVGAQPREDDMCLVAMEVTAAARKA